jgi:hypothetical protein
MLLGLVGVAAPSPTPERYGRPRRHSGRPAPHDYLEWPVKSAHHLRHQSARHRNEGHPVLPCGNLLQGAPPSKIVSILHSRVSRHPSRPGRHGRRDSTSPGRYEVRRTFRTNMISRRWQSPWAPPRGRPRGWSCVTGIIPAGSDNDGPSTRADQLRRPNPSWTARSCVSASATCCRCRCMPARAATRARGRRPAAGTCNPAGTNRVTG